MVGFTGIASAQQVKKKVEPTAAKLEKVKPAVAVTAVKEGDAPKKADGTLDKRYKVNKQKLVPSGKLKKDGTPDKRFKENKIKRG
ncbi:MAG: hypothetical protein IPP72_20380 [Chitinophagaceae bacterium]|nr:hypothetical protein [Chitinophagaceae bacterium]